MRLRARWRRRTARLAPRRRRIVSGLVARRGRVVSRLVARRGRRIARSAAGLLSWHHDGPMQFQRRLAVSARAALRGAVSSIPGRISPSGTPVSAGRKFLPATAVFRRMCRLSCGAVRTCGSGLTVVDLAVVNLAVVGLPVVDLPIVYLTVRGGRASGVWLRRFRTAVAHVAACAACWRTKLAPAAAISTGILLRRVAVCRAGGRAAGRRMSVVHA